MQGESGRGSPVSDDADELADIKQEGDLWQSGAGIPDTGAQDGPDSQGMQLLTDYLHGTGVCAAAWI